VPARAARSLFTTHTGSATLTKKIRYYDTGEPYLVTDVNTSLQTNHVWRAREALQGTGTASSYDAEGHPVSFEGSTVVYDALGRAVDAGGHELVHGPGGGIMAEMTGQTAVNEYVPPARRRRRRLSGHDARLLPSRGLAAQRALGHRPLAHALQRHPIRGPRAAV
jgi:hypothetical protein